jgi:ribosome-binding factor A
MASREVNGMGQGSRADRVADQLRGELALVLGREVHDPGVGFVTLTRVHMSPDLQTARVYYTTLGDDASRRRSARALERAAPFLRRQVGSRLRLRRVPEITFIYDDSIAGQDRIEQLLNEIHAERAIQDSIRSENASGALDLEPQAPAAGGDGTGDEQAGGSKAAEMNRTDDPDHSNHRDEQPR